MHLWLLRPLNFWTYWFVFYLRQLTIRTELSQLCEEISEFCVDRLIIGYDSINRGTTYGYPKTTSKVEA